MTSSGRKDDPLDRLSLLVLTFNQEQYIADALTSALSQSVPSLEVVISDDCSKDRTFHLIQEIVNRYNGNFDVKVNRNSKNLGIMGNLYAGLELVSNDWVVLGAGDDVYHFDRCKVILEVLKSNNGIKGVYSDVQLIDAGGNLIPKDLQSTRKERHSVRLVEIASGGGGVGIGAAYCYHRSVFYEPWPLATSIRSEDRVLPLRAWLAGGLIHISDKLVRYRVNHGFNLGQQLYDSGQLAIQCSGHREEIRNTLLWANRNKKITRIEYSVYMIISSLSRIFANLKYDYRTNESKRIPVYSRLKIEIVKITNRAAVFAGTLLCR